MSNDCCLFDVVEIVNRLETFCARRNVGLSQSKHRLISTILEYIELRQTLRAHSISTPRTPIEYPDGWTDEQELCWNDWLATECSNEHWTEEIMNLFGTDIRIWENSCEGWRDEIRLFLPWWIARNASVLVGSGFGPGFGPGDSDYLGQGQGQGQGHCHEQKRTLDPFVLEHGTSKQRKKALRTGC
jgi:hypothetical protein